jgi:PRC-barrel domain
MLKTLMMSAAVSALMISGALAQTNPPASSQTAKSEATESKSPRFIQTQGTDHWVFSKFKGTDVLGPDDAKVGNITDLLFDRNGKIEGLIVGVGGFLGIGEKNVAIDMSAFQVVPYGVSTNTAMSSENDPTRVNLKVSWTKDELKAAPDFQYYRAPPRTAERPGGSPTTGMAPRPAAPSPMAPAPRQ